MRYLASLYRLLVLDILLKINVFFCYNNVIGIEKRKRKRIKEIKSTECFETFSFFKKEYEKLLKIEYKLFELYKYFYFLRYVISNS